MTSFHLLNDLAQPISPSSHAAESGGFIFLTGQIGRDLNDAGAPLPEGIEGQTTQALENVRTVLGRLGIGISEIVSVRVYLTQFARDYEPMNSAYHSFFGVLPRPSRTCIGVSGLVRDALVEIDCVAARPRANSRRAKALRQAYGASSPAGAVVR